MGKFINLKDKKFGRLLVLEKAKNIGKNTAWKCLCDCGNIKNITSSRLKSGNTLSCGCLRKENLIKNNKNKIRNFENEEINKIISLYNDGYTVRKIRGIFNTGDELIKKVLINNNVQIREYEYKFNEYFFEDIDTEEKAYWLGFIYADGYVSKNGIELSLKSTDELHLKKFLIDINAKDIEIKDKTINLNDKIYFAKRINLNSKILSNNLHKHGCVQAKSLILKFPEHLNKELIRHFIRGYFDGDGTIYTNELNTFNFSILGTKDMMNKILDIIVDNCDINKLELKNHHTSTSIKKIAYGGKYNCYKILKYLYKDATIYLERKFKKYKTLMNIIEKNTSSDNKKIVVISGHNQVGKDTFIELLGKNNFVKNISSIDKIKYVAKILGWDGITKDEKTRKFLHDLKMLSTNYNDFPYLFIKNEINEFMKLNLKAYYKKRGIMFIIVREPNEIDKLKKEFPKIKTLLIKNNRVEQIISNDADRLVENYDYDYIIENNGTINELESKANLFVDQQFYKY